jgi:MFS family permease
MAIGRLLGDRIVARFGGAPVLRYGALLASASMALAILAPNPWLSILGFTLAGFGFAPIVPVAFSASGSIPGVSPSWAIAKVSGVAYIGMLGGPPIIGFIAHHTSLAWALAVPATLIALVATCASVVAPADDRTA